MSMTVLLLLVLFILFSPTMGDNGRCYDLLTYLAQHFRVHQIKVLGAVIAPNLHSVAQSRKDVVQRASEIGAFSTRKSA